MPNTLNAAMPRVMADVKDLLKLAWPVILNRAGVFSLSVVDTIMVGQYAATELAYLGVGQVPMGIGILLAIGLLMGTMVLSSAHFGAGEYQQCGVVWWRSLPFALLIGGIGFVICFFGEPLLLLFSQPPDIAANAGRISIILGLGLPFAALNITTVFFLESINKVKPGMVIVLIANVLNIFLNSIFINGGMGVEPMGAEGSAWSSLIVRILQSVMVLAFVWHMADWKKFGVRHRPSLAWHHAARQRQIGYASGLSMGIENTAFNMLILFAGMIGATVVAAYSITFNIFALCFMIGLGFGSATAVRVGNAYGAKKFHLVARYSWIGLGTQMSFLFVLVSCFYVFAPFLVGAYTQDAEVIALAILLLKYALLALLFDAAQALMVQSLRARQDIWAALLIHFVSFGLVMIPMAYLAIFYWERGPIGMIDGLVGGTMVATLMAVTRVVQLNRQHSRQHNNPHNNPTS